MPRPPTRRSSGAARSCGRAEQGVTRPAGQSRRRAPASVTSRNYGRPRNSAWPSAAPTMPCLRASSGPLPLPASVARPSCGRSWKRAASRSCGRRMRWSTTVAHAVVMHRTRILRAVAAGSSVLGILRFLHIAALTGARLSVHGAVTPPSAPDPQAASGERSIECPEVAHRRTSGMRTSDPIRTSTSAASIFR